MYLTRMCSASGRMLDPLVGLNMQWHRRVFSVPISQKEDKDTTARCQRAKNLQQLVINVLGTPWSVEPNVNLHRFQNEDEKKNKPQPRQRKSEELKKSFNYFV